MEFEAAATSEPSHYRQAGCSSHTATEETPHIVGTAPQIATDHMDNDILSVVRTFMQENSRKLQVRSWQERAFEITRWLSSQIQTERQGWMMKLKMAMQEIDQHRHEALIAHSLMQECAEHLHLLLDSCSIISGKFLDIPDDCRTALPIYIKILSEVVSFLMEERVKCFEILKPERPEENLPNLLSKYVDDIRQTAEAEIFISKVSTQILPTGVHNLESNFVNIKETVTSKVITNDLHTAQKNKNNKINPMHKPTSDINEKDNHRKMDYSDHPELTGPRRLIINKEEVSMVTEPPAITTKKVWSQSLQGETCNKGQHENNHDQFVKNNTKKRDLDKNDPVSEMWPYPVSSSECVTIEERSHSYSGPGETTSKLLPPVLGVKKMEPQTAPARTNNHSSPRRQDKERLTARSDDKERERLQIHTHFRSTHLSKCLRCNKLFKPPDNHKLACCYHSKGKKRMERYDDSGKLIRVTYNWQCCNKGMDNAGCCFGPHV